MERDLVLNGVRIGEYQFSPEIAMKKLNEECIPYGMNYVEISACNTDYGKDFYVDFGMRVRAAANKAVAVAHPTNPSTRTIALTVIYEQLGDAPLHVRNTVLFGDGQMDRSPCGSGTSALMTLMHHLGKLDIGAPYVSESFIGSVFHGQLKEETLVGPFRAVVPLVRGQANLMARCEFYREDADPFPNGFVVD
jgi:proline racemase